MIVATHPSLQEGLSRRRGVHELVPIPPWDGLQIGTGLERSRPVLAGGLATGKADVVSH
jgi:hypothetical protein